MKSKALFQGQDSLKTWAAGLLLSSCVTSPPRARAADQQTLTVAAAADLVFCLEKLDADFQKANPGAQIKVATGSSGNFFTQIQSGAPFDVFLSADMKYPRDLAAQGLADGSTLTEYAAGRIVVWTTRPDIDVSQGLASLRNPAIKKVAMANPDHAPYGRAAKEALQHEGLWEMVEPKLVIGENIAQTAQFVQTGNADAGIVALSLVVAPSTKGVGKFQQVPDADYPALEQGAVVTKHGEENPWARKYLDFLRSPEARAVFDAFGFRLPASAAAPASTVQP
jgi:molybdate transport system substrate-binding protein